jgi:hypothetical protein
MNKKTIRIMKKIVILMMVLISSFVVCEQYIKKSKNIVSYNKLLGGVPASIFSPEEKIDKEAIGLWGEVNSGLQMRIIGFYDINTPYEHFVLEIRNVSKKFKQIMIDFESYDSNGKVVGRYKSKRGSTTKRVKMLHSAIKHKKLYSIVKIKPQCSFFLIKRYPLFYLNNMTNDIHTFVYKIPYHLLDKGKKKVAVDSIYLKSSILLPGIKVNINKKKGGVVIDRNYVGPAIFKYKEFIAFMDRCIKKKKLIIFTPPPINQ